MQINLPHRPVFCFPILETKSKSKEVSMAFLPQVKGWPWSGTKRTTVFQITGSSVLIAGQNWSLINTAIYITRKLDLSSTVANKEGIHSEKIPQFRQFVELVPWTHTRGLISSLCTKSEHSLFLKTLPPKCVAQKQTLCSNWECKGEMLVQKAFIGIICRNNMTCSPWQVSWCHGITRRWIWPSCQPTLS